MTDGAFPRYFHGKQWLMSDLVFNGGKYGIWVGNQQFIVPIIAVGDAQVGVFAAWNWNGGGSKTSISTTAK